MARRRQLVAPSPEALKEIEAGIDRDLSRTGLRPPIADVVADAASHADPLPQAEREAIARDKSDANRLRAAEDKGLVAIEIPLHEVTADALNRDRISLDEEDMQELMTSILANGLRLPIEVFESESSDGGGHYALISGYRRLAALRRLNAQSDGSKFRTIAAFVRTPGTIAKAMVSMIEENEVRSGLSQYERGRAAATAVHEGVFPSVDDAVSVLFQSASKAKRSKIRSFALIHEELGDMLLHGTGLNERQCLRIAASLRLGQAEAMRQALEAIQARSSAEEWEALLPVIEGSERSAPQEKSRGGRPKSEKSIRKSRRTEIGNGVAIEQEEGPSGFAIRFHGDGVDADLIARAMAALEQVLLKDETAE